MVMGELTEKLEEAIDTLIIPELQKTCLLPPQQDCKKNQPYKYGNDIPPVCTLIFDREGYHPSFFKKLWDDYHIAVITYRKNVPDKWDESSFKDTVVTVLGQNATMHICEQEVVLDGFTMREIRRLGEDGHQTSLHDYGIVKYYIRFAEAISQLTYPSVYLIDYYKKGFSYVSDNPLFLCGKSARQVQQAGYSFYLKNVPHDDLKLLLKINEAGFAFYNSIAPDEKTDYTISYDFRLKQPNGRLLLINHKLTPLALDMNGNIWIALCVVSLSPNKKPGNILIRNASEQISLIYDLTEERWIEQGGVTLNNQEKEILALSSQGLTVEKIAAQMFLSVDTIKFHRKSLFKKLKVKSISEAILTAANIGLI